MTYRLRRARGLALNKSLHATSQRVDWRAGIVWLKTVGKPNMDSRMRFTLMIAALWALLSAVPVQAQNRVVVELYTSQGCSSCPPADALLQDLAQQRGVIALALHVDYWDYIGWKDEFGRPENAARQRSYAAAGGRRSVYTPQMVIAGEDSVVGTHPMDVADLIAKHSRSQKDVAMKAVRTGEKITIAATARRPAKYEVKFVSYANKRTSAIKRGENAGRTITYVNVVLDYKTVKKWDGRAPLSLAANAGKGPIVVLIQRAGHGPIEAAAALN